jgi:DNA primase
MDVIALHQAEITNAVAPLGTAFTDEQAKLLGRWVKKIILWFDIDEAGQNATVKAILCCRKAGIPCAVVDVTALQKQASEARGEVSPSLQPQAAYATPSAGDTPATPPKIESGHPGIGVWGEAPGEGGSGKAQSPLAGDGFEARGETGAPAPSPPLPSLPPKDPADILKDFGPDHLKNYAKRVILDFEYLLARSRQTFNASDSAGKAKAVAFLFPFLDFVDSEVERASYFRTIADAFGADAQSVLNDYKNWKKGQRAEHRPPGGTEQQKIIMMTEELYLLTAVSIYFGKRTDLWLQLRKALPIEDFNDPNAKELYIVLEECYRTEAFETQELLEKIENAALKHFVLEKISKDEFSGNSDQLVADSIRRIKEKRVAAKLKELITKMRIAKSSGGDIDDLILEKKYLDTELLKLKGEVK